jgi:periplasmic protein TonB
MFEQATLTNGPAGARAWTTLLGLSSQVALVSLAVLAPMVWPQVIPAARFLETIAPPLPPAAPPKPLGALKEVPASGKAMKPVPWSLTKYSPSIVPSQVYMIVDEPVGPSVVGSYSGSSDAAVGVVGSILGEIKDAARVAPPPSVPPVAKPAAETAAVIHRYKEGGKVSLGTPLRRSEPQYPPIAKAAHVSGSVELECVVGVNGHIQEVKVKSGNPLLIHAAVDAAWQWIYAPSKLNDMPIEIITNLTFTFKLN